VTHLLCVCCHSSSCTYVSLIPVILFLSDLFVHRTIFCQFTTLVIHNFSQIAMWIIDYVVDSVVYSKLNAALRSSFDCQVAMNLSSTKSELLPSVSKSFGIKLCHISRLFWPDCKPEGPLFSAEFVCLSVCVCIF